MSVTGAQPNQYGSGHFNSWAMLRALNQNNIGVLAFDGTPVNGTSGSFAKFAGPGTMVIDINTGNIFVNTGTKTSPIWSGMGNAVVGNAGLGAVRTAKVTYDFAVDGGAIGLITPANAPTLPAKAVIIGGVLDITTTLTSGGSATISLGTDAGSSATSLKAATAVASYAAGFLAINPVFTAATYVKLTAAGKPTLTVAVAALTAGKFDLNLNYVIGN